MGKKPSKPVVMHGEEYVSMRRTTEMTGYGPSNIYRLVDTGVIRRVKRGCTHVYNLADIERYIYGGTNETRESTEDSGSEI
jgi:hypothetical protein